jgi:DeoR/GlpR family transcriptional regulator of sugar metabolism
MHLPPSQIGARRLDPLAMRVLACYFSLMHDSSALPFDRRQQIARRLTLGNPVSAAALATEFKVSEDAIRRDLRALSAEGLCKRVYGGALPVSPASSPIHVRSREDVGQKQALVRAAVALVREGQTLFLDTGSTNYELAKELPRDAGLTVVTNAVPVASALMDGRGISLIMIGGSVDTTVGGCLGTRSIAEIQRFRIDLCFLGTCAISVKHGIAGFNMADVDFKRSLIDVSAETALILTTAKLETTAPHRIGSVADVEHLVVEHDAPAAILAALRATGAAVRMANAPSVG